MGKRVIVHEEAQFSEDNQEKIKVLMEGGGGVCTVPRKSKSKVYYLALVQNPKKGTCKSIQTKGQNFPSLF